MKDFCDKYSVSRETYSLLEKYCQELKDWQCKMNLVGANTLKDLWSRHIEDSAQIFELIPTEAKNLLDIGSGAGFPGMVLGIMSLCKTPYLKITLTDSIKKKTLFLNHIKDAIHLDNVEVLNIRAEQIKDQKFSVITARAVTALTDLLGYANHLLKKDGVCIFPKGKSYQQEINDASKKWKFSLSVVDSKTSDEGKILIISNLRKQGE